MPKNQKNLYFSKFQVQTFLNMKNTFTNGQITGNALNISTTGISSRAKIEIKKKYQQRADHKTERRPPSRLEPAGVMEGYSLETKHEPTTTINYKHAHYIKPTPTTYNVATPNLETGRFSSFFHGRRRKEIFKCPSSKTRRLITVLGRAATLLGGAYRCKHTI